MPDALQTTLGRPTASATLFFLAIVVPQQLEDLVDILPNVAEDHHDRREIAILHRHELIFAPLSSCCN